MDRELQDKINNIPNDVQQRYIQANMELRNLMTKEVLADDVYVRMFDEVSRNNDMEQIRQFEDSHISESEYDNEIDRLEKIISEIDNRYGFTNEDLNNEFDLDVKEKRNRLKGIKSYYERNGSYIMRNVNVDVLTDNEVMDMYEQIESGIGYDRVRNMIDNSNEYEAEKERNERLDPIRQRVDRFRTSRGVDRENITGNGSSSNGNDFPESQTIEHTDIDRKVNKLKEDFEVINSDINEINGKLILNQDLSSEVNEDIRKIDLDVKELADDVQEIISEMDNFKEKYEHVDFSMNYQEITNELKKIKSKLRKLKQEQVKRYNNSVEVVNKAIDELRRLNTPEIDSKLDMLEPLNMCNANITHWNDSVRYIDDIDYDKLIDTNRVLYEIYNAKNNKEEEVIANIDDGKNNEWSITMLELYTDIENIEDEINNIESEFTEIMPENEINRLRDSIKCCSDNVNAFRAKLENNKDKISDEDYKVLEDRCDGAQEELMDLNSVLNEKGLNNASVSVNNKDIYEELMRRMNTLSGALLNLDDLVETLDGLMNKDTVDRYRDLLNNKYIIDMNDLEQEIENMNKTGKLDSNQYNNLKKELDSVKELVQRLNEKLRNPGIIKDADIFAVLNGEIDGLEKALDKLEEQVSKLDKPIKRENRKEIDKIVKHLEKEFNRLSKLAEQYKEKEPDKYNELMERLGNVNNRLSKFKKDYRKKCPLLVRAVKSAKDFYKRHKKIILIAAGLTTFAMLGQYVLIPAIVHGNMMVWETVPALRSTIEFINKLLGSIGGLVKGSIGESWYTANGVLINPSVAASSLLKGLAISGIGTSALIAPMIVAIKKLVDKMNIAELKQKLKEEKEILDRNRKEKNKNTKDKLQNVKRKIKGSVSSFYNDVPDQYTFDDIEDEYYRYKRSGKTLDEYVDIGELTENDIAVFKYLDKNEKENNIDDLYLMLLDYRKSGLSLEEFIDDVKLDKEDEMVLKNLLGCIDETKKKYNIGIKNMRRK